MQYEFVFEHLTRCGCGALQQVVVVAVNAGYHVTAVGLAQHVHHSLFLAFGELGARRQHYLEMYLVAFVFVENRTPERYVIIAFDVCYDALCGSLWT